MVPMFCDFVLVVFWHVCDDSWDAVAKIVASTAHTGTLRRFCNHCCKSYRGIRSVKNTVIVYHGKCCDMLSISVVHWCHFATQVAKIVAKVANFLQLLQQSVTARSSDQSHEPPTHCLSAHPTTIIIKLRINNNKNAESNRKQPREGPWQRSGTRRECRQSSVWSCVSSSCQICITLGVIKNE